MVFIHDATTSSAHQRLQRFSPELEQGLRFKLRGARRLFCFRAIFKASSCIMAMSSSGKDATHIEKAAAAFLPAESAIDKSMFDVPYDLLAIRVPKKHSGFVSKTLKRFVFDMPRVRHIIPDPSSSDFRLILLSEKVSDTSLSEIPAESLASLKSVTGFEVIKHQLVLGYNYWPADYILKALLPDGCETQSAFETIGHIAHLNIRDELVAHKNLIASVILEKNKPKIRTILNKVGTITNEFRVPTFEVLAGDQSLITEVKQHGATFRLDYGLVYWNSRLEHEHIRLVSQFLPKQVICDMFAGIGPFAIPAAQKGCIVYANDLNPESIKYLQINIKLNKVSKNVHVFNEDAREFVRHIVKLQKPIVADEHHLQMAGTEECNMNEPVSSSFVASQAIQACNDLEHGKPWEHIDHIIMNLPASALDFLDIFRGLFRKARWKGAMPRIHCYCFVRSRETVADVLKKAERVLGGTIMDPTVWEVRDVAPNKAMLCLSFDLPEKIAFEEHNDTECTTPILLNSEGTLKKPRLEKGSISSGCT